MLVPSGRTYDDLDLEIVRGFNQHKVIEWLPERRKLKSGVLSHVYVQGRDDLTYNMELLLKVGDKTLNELDKILDETVLQPCFIGLPTAGTAIAGSIAFADAYMNGYHHVCWDIMREKKKDTHGKTGGWVVRPPDHGNYIYFAVDNVVTDGKTKIEADERFREDGFQVDQMHHVIMVDRQQGGIERMRAHGMKHIHVLYNLLDLTFAYRELDLWPAESVAAVENEIREHQFAA
jgi:orotate phosphoribosyltransferase